MCTTPFAARDRVEDKEHTALLENIAATKVSKLYDLQDLMLLTIKILFQTSGALKLGSSRDIMNGTHWKNLISQLLKPDMSRYSIFSLLLNL
jgi:hypothetical protein